MLSIPGLRIDKMTSITNFNQVVLIGFYWIYCRTSLGADFSYVVNTTCPDGWVKALNNCYYFNNKDLITWQEARTECNVRNADLMFIKNIKEREWINSQTKKYSTDGWWVGLVYTMHNSWGWVQAGGDTSLVNWRHEPDNVGGQECCAINEFGLFSNEFCNSKLGFICKYPINRGEYCVSTTNRWLMTDTACLYISPQENRTLQMTWNDAKKYCSHLVPDRSPQLLSINSLNEMETLQNLLRTYDTTRVLIPWWTGMNKLADKGQYVWQNTSTVNTSFIKWDIAPSRDRSKKRNCGVMFQGGLIDDMTCDKRAHYICETSAFQGYFNLGCGSWLRAGSSCYLISQGKGYSWTQASVMCSRANSQLMKVDDLDEKFWLQTLELGNSGFWTGLNARTNKRSWVWTDGSSPNQSLISWAKEPNNYKGNENCASIYRLGSYNDLKCDAKIGFICEYTIAPGVNCTPGWLKRGMSSCYFFVTSNVSSVTWEEAKDRCNDLVSSNGLVAYRLAVNDKEEQAWINGQLLYQPAETPWFWTGLNDKKNEGIWQYDEDFNNPPNNDVIDWAKEPNNINGTENCAAVYDGGFLNDVNCEYRINFICERPVYRIKSASNEANSKLYKGYYTLLSVHILIWLTSL